MLLLWHHPLVSFSERNYEYPSPQYSATATATTAVKRTRVATVNLRQLLKRRRYSILLLSPVRFGSMRKWLGWRGKKVARPALLALEGTASGDFQGYFPK
jgi:hypothetical protein